MTGRSRLDLLSKPHLPSLVRMISCSSPHSSHSRGLRHLLFGLAIAVFLFGCGWAQSATAKQPVANFVDIAEKAGLTMKNVFGGLDTKKYIVETTGTGVAIFDYDNDGWPDIFFVNGTTLEDMKAGKSGPTNHLYRNNHDGTFTDVTVQCGLNHVIVGMGANFGDLDNDGYLDFYVGTGNPDLETIVPNRMFRNDAGKRFQDVTSSGGFGNLQKGHGVSFGDIDNNGTQDIYENMGGAVFGDVYHNVLYLNPGHSNHWVTLKLEGVQSNRAAIGSRIRVVVQSATGEHSYYKTVGTGGSFGASPLRQEIGLGQAQSIDRVEIFWPRTGRTQVLTGLKMDHFYKVSEDQAQAMLWDLKSFQLKTTGGEVHHHHHQ